MMVKTISALAVYDAIKSGQELAFLDVREQGVYAQGHPLFAIFIPLSRFELTIDRLVPRKNVPVILFDQGGGEKLAQRAALFLQQAGFSDVSVMEEGVSGWRKAGLELFSGVNVPSKAFGELVEHECQTPHITAEQLQGRLDKGETVVILDSRPFDEFERMCIPGGIDMPGAELVHRVFGLLGSDEETPVVVNCAGRTRSIIGAQSLINAGIKNPVMALKDGIMGWYLQGYKLEDKAQRVAPAPSLPALEKSVAAARDLGARAGIQMIDRLQLETFQANADKQSLFLLDVRTKAEFLEGYVAGSQHAPGGQLVQACDEYVGVRGAVLVLIDDREVRAWMTASWLAQLGWPQVYVFKDLDDVRLLTGEDDQIPVPETDYISPMELDAVIASGEPAAVIDLAPSSAYREGHIPGAFWMIRARADFDLNMLPAVGFVVITADDERLAHLAAPEIKAIRPELIVRVLQDGNTGWRKAGYKITADNSKYLSAIEDVWRKPYDDASKVRERMQEYLDWEVALVPQIERDGSTAFNILKPGI